MSILLPTEVRHCAKFCDLDLKGHQLSVVSLNTQVPTQKFSNAGLTQEPLLGISIFNIDVGTVTSDIPPG